MDIAQSQRPCKNVVHPADGAVQIRVHIDRSDIVLRQIQDGAPNAVPVGDGMRRDKDERVVRYDQLRAKLLRLAADVLKRVQCDQDTGHLSIFAAAQQPHVVPVLRQLARRPVKQRALDVKYRYHASTLLSSPAVRR